MQNLCNQQGKRKITNRSIPAATTSLYQYTYNNINEHYPLIILQLKYISHGTENHLKIRIQRKILSGKLN